MDRRKFIGSAAGLAAALALAGNGCSPQEGNAKSGPAGGAKNNPGPVPPVAAGERPNIIIIMADDLGFGDIGCYGSRAISTPNIDRLADEGVKLTSFFASGPVCSPSRAGLLTGRYPIRSGVNGVYFPAKNPLSLAIHGIQGIGAGMPTDEITLAQAIKAAGYATCCIGKWHLGDLKKYRPHHRGFDHYFGVLFSNDMPHLNLFRNDEIVEKAPADQDHLTQKYTKEAVGWIEDNHDRPFFLYLPHTFPHRPIHASPEFSGNSKGGLYGDCVEEIDWSTGEIMKALDRLGIADNTFIFFTSDNGPWFQGSPGGYRGRKYETFDGGMRVPGIARWPGKIPAGTVNDELSMNIDLFTTALAMAGVQVPNDRPIDGKNIMPMLKGNEASPHQALFLYKDDMLQAVRTGKWKYHRRHKSWTTGHFYYPIGPFLFNLEDDPDESYDVSGRYPEKAAELENMMNEWEKNLVKGVPKSG